MESTFASRIRQYRQHKGLSQQAFAEQCDLTQGNIAHMESGTEPKQSNVSKLVAGFPDLSTDWLLLGTGPMLKDGRVLTPNSQLPPQVPSKTESEPMRINREGEEGPGYWQVIASDRLREIEFLKELLRASNGIRPADEETATTASVGKAHASSDAASLYELVDEIHSETQRLVVAGFGTYRRLGMAS